VVTCKSMYAYKHMRNNSIDQSIVQRWFRIKAWALGELGADSTLPAPSIDIVVSHNTAATRLCRLTEGLSKLASGAMFASFTATLDVLLIAGRSARSVDNPSRGVGTRDLARSRHQCATSTCAA